MSANATGTPTTNFSIPKFNTASDAPNGKGVNEMMDALDTLIANPASVVTRPASLADHDVPVWNGTTWVRSATRQINNGGQILPVITTSSLAGGPPGNPADGDIWIATAVDASGTRWTFQYNAGSGSPYKWEFIGGGIVYSTATPNVNISALTQVGTTGWFYPSGCNLTLARAGEYDVRMLMRWNYNANATDVALALGNTNPNNVGTGATSSSGHVDATVDTCTAPFEATVAVAAGQTVNPATQGATSSTVIVFTASIAVVPRRIA